MLGCIPRLKFQQQGGIGPVPIPQRMTCFVSEENTEIRRNSWIACFSTHKDSLQVAPFSLSLIKASPVVDGVGVGRALWPSAVHSCMTDPLMKLIDLPSWSCLSCSLACQVPSQFNGWCLFYIPPGNSFNTWPEIDTQPS